MKALLRIFLLWIFVMLFAIGMTACQPQMPDLYTWLGIIIMVFGGAVVYKTWKIFDL